MIEAIKRNHGGTDEAEVTALPDARRDARPAPQPFSWNILSAIWAHPIVFVVTLLATLAAAGLYLVSVQPRYVATAIFTIDPQVLFHQESERNYPDPSLAESQTQLLRSDLILLPAVRSSELQGLRDDLLLPGLLDPVRETLSRSSGEVDAEAAIVKSLRDNTRILRAGRSYVVEMSVAALSPQAAALGANTIARTYLDRAAQERAEAQRSTQLRLEMALADAWEAQVAAEDNLRDFRVSRPGTGQAARPEGGRGEALDAALAAANERVAQAEARLERATPESTAALEASLASALAWRDRVQEAVDETTGFEARQREDQITLARLQARAEARRLAYEEQLQALSQFAQRAPVGSNATMLSAARLPDRPASPQPVLTIAAALFAGTLLAAVLCLLRAYLRWRKKSVQSV
jgi:uncharacterized protein involved in exopolysaccharide biosynthesis